jgi:ADP-ribose pyrophosphatase YjhB (NUDIX family)
MANLVFEERAGKEGKLAMGCSASIFDAGGQRVLLGRRADNGCWGVPGGYMEPGESLTEACAREVWEETGLRVRVTRLVGAYTSPHLRVEYPDGNRWQIVVLHFEAEPVGGTLLAGDETTEVGYFTVAEAEQLDMNPLDRRCVLDGFARQTAAFVCDDFVGGGKGR